MAMPKIAFKWSPSDHWAWRANYSMDYRSPSIKELFFNWDHLGMFMIKGNEDLKPEKNNYVSLGTEYSNDNFFISGNVYGNFFRKKIEGVWRIYDMQYNFEYTNLAKQNLIGLEAHHALALPQPLHDECHLQLREREQDGWHPGEHHFASCCYGEPRL